MPEGPEVRKYADALDKALGDRRIIRLSARTKSAKAWLEANEARLFGKHIERVYSHGKHLIGLIEGGFYFHSHLMMWGSWQTFTSSPPEIDRRERARIVVEGASAILYSAPVFNVGRGKPERQVEFLNSLGPDALPYDNKFDAKEFRKRLVAKRNRTVTIGAALLNQQIVAGLGNYLRAEILFACRVNPWKQVGGLSEKELECLTRVVPLLTRRSCRAGATARRPDRERMRLDPTLVYQPGREYGTRHLVFRRTNLPCLRCGNSIRQLRQATQLSNDEERERIVYFCARCQDVDL